MPITIQEIIASDTISELVDKTNFNFDQLLLNGGGPAGPAGPAGPTGPTGGRGEKGSTWYEDTSSTLPGNDPTVVPPTATPLEADYYLQFNGQVWEYTGLTWSSTTINLTGPTGPAGAAGGFGLEFGSPLLLNKNTVYNQPIGLGAGANTTNEGVPSVMMGGAVTNTAPLSAGIPLTAAYVIPNAIATAVTSDIASVVVHQKNSDGRSLVFHGGAAPGNNDLYEQTSISQLSGIKIAVDDVLTLDVPKNKYSSATSQAQMRGIHLSSPERAQFFEAGSNILMQTGGDQGAALFGSQHSNFQVTVGAGPIAGGAKFIVSTLGTSGTTLTEAGNITALATTSALVGKWQVLSGEIRLVSSASDEIGLYSGGSILLTTTEGTAPTGQIRLLTDSGDIGMAAVTGDITQTTTTGNNTTSTTSGNISITTSANTGGDITLQATYGDIRLQNTVGGDIEIWSSVASNPSSISIYAGIGGTGSIDIRSRLLDTTINAIDADVVIQNNTQTRVQFLGGTTIPAGRIMVGGGTSPIGTNTYTVYQPLIVIDSAEEFGTDNTPTDTMHVGISPTEGVVDSNPQGPGYNGGGEIIGPYGVQLSVSNPVSYSPWQKENQGTLHIRSNVTRGTFGKTGITPGANGLQTTLPGSLWMYPTIPTQTDDVQSSGGSALANGDNINANVRLWSTPKPKYLSGGSFYGTSGITIGLNSMQESAITPFSDYGAPNVGTPVSGRVYLYGQRALDNNGDGSPLDQNKTPSGGTNTKKFAGGVNIGDQWRGRQAFKVWGDYVGHYYVSRFGGAVSGNIDPATRAEQQCFMSGAQGFSSGWITNMGSVDSQQASAAKFKYKYQWQRVGRVVTGSGMIKTQVNRSGTATPGTTYDVPSSELVLWGGTGGSSFNTDNDYFVTIGPIPWPLQVGDANTNDIYPTVPGNQQGVDNLNISGAVVSVLDGQTIATVTANPINSAAGGAFLIQYPLPTGIVGGGSSTEMYEADPTPTPSTATNMWLKVYPILSAIRVGAIPSYLKFTFSYEVNP
jgi:hypothetical protein|tara:strand:- start:67 stop:3138 length:3072 start_codon:yes stop_codon:yes gene_type:complete